MRKLKIKYGNWDLDLEMAITVIDEEKLKKECQEINQFWSGNEKRLAHHGSQEKSGLALFAQECFQQIAFNNFKDKNWLEEQFDWDIKHKGIEGFPSIKELGIRIDHIETWFVESDDVEFEEIKE